MPAVTNIRYIAEPKHVREVSLIGTCDLQFWSDYLRPEGLAPAQYGDGAQVRITAAELAYLGIRFTEVSIGVHVALPGEGSKEGVRLLRAFSSSRLFAWCERRLFATPHSWAECQVSVQSPVSVSVRAFGGRALQAEMSPSVRAFTRAGQEDWEGPVFLPPRSPVDDGPLFFARLCGHAVVYPFLKGDRVVIDGSAGDGMLRSLIDSGFSAAEWMVRADGIHARSKTYRRTHVPGA